MMTKPAGFSGLRLPLLLAALALAAYLVWSDDQKGTELVPAIARAGGPSRPTAVDPSLRPSAAAQASAMTIQALLPRAASHTIKDAFLTRKWRKEPLVAAVVPGPVVVVPQAPEAPPLPYVYLGKQFRDGRWQVFLGLQERTLIVKDNDTVDGVWRVGEIRPPSLGVVHLPTGQQRSLAIGAGD